MWIRKTTPKTTQNNINKRESYEVIVDFAYCIRYNV